MAYIGRQPGTGVRSRYLFTATSGQTTFSTSDTATVLSYTDTAYLDVYLNGVLLDPASDYTATSGTSVVLSSGASTDDILECIVYDVFSVFSGNFNTNVNVNGSFTSLGIDDNATSNAVTIDSDGNVGIGTSSPDGKLDVRSSEASAETVAQFGNFNIQGGLQVQTNGNLDWGFNALNSRNLTFSTNQTERLRIDSSGNISFYENTGTTPKLTWDSSAQSLSSASSLNAGAVGNNSSFIASGFYGGGVALNDGAYSGIYADTGGTNLHFYVGQNVATETAASARTMTITSAGHVGIGEVNPSYPVDVKSTTNGDIVFRAIHQGSGSVAFHGKYVSSSGTAYWGYWVYNGAVVGSITSTGSSTAYNTSSDYRLKENVTGITDGIERIKQLNPSRFNFIADADTTVDGFLAHEVSDVVPEAITGEKDAMRDEEYEITPAVLDDDGNVVTEAVMGTRSVPDYQGIDQAKLVPLLTAALQEAITKIEDLEAQNADIKARLNALEGN